MQIIEIVDLWRMLGFLVVRKEEERRAGLAVVVPSEPKQE
jgi:hypothetical protein